MPLITDIGLAWCLDRTLGRRTDGFGLTLRLYTTRMILDTDVVTADFRECTLPLYAAVPVTPSAWIPSGIPDLVRLGYPQVTFLLGEYISPAVSIYGWFITETTASTTLFCDEGPAPYVVPNSGGSLGVVVDLYGLNCPP